VNGFIAHLHTRLGTARNYSAIAILHASQITTAPTKPLSSLLCLHQPSLATASNSPALRFSLPCRAHLTSCPNSLLLIPRRGPHGKHTVSNKKSIVACVCVSAGRFSPSRYSGMAICVFVCCIAVVLLVVCFEVLD
jgi:hypothetical protein